jgi:putative tricarboxylic transport membrane protein
VKIGRRERDDAVAEPEALDTRAIDAAVAEEEEEHVVVPWGPLATWVRRFALIVLFPAFSIFYLSQALTIELPNRELLVSPRGFPTTVAIVMIAVSVALAVLELVRLVRGRRAESEGRILVDQEDDDTERISSWRDVWVTLGALAIYIALFTVLGFAIATFLFLMGVSTYFQPAKWLRNLISCAVFSVAVYLLFAHVLGVQLPGGLLAGVL